MSDPWADEGFGGDDDWEGKEGVEVDVEDEDELDPEELDDETDADDELDDED